MPTQKTRKTGGKRTIIDLYCHDCGAIVKAYLASDTMEVLCRYCRSKNVFSYPMKNNSNQQAHHKRLMRKIKENIKKQNKENFRGYYILKESWVNELYGE